MKKTAKYQVLQHSAGKCLVAADYPTWQPRTPRYNNRYPWRVWFILFCGVCGILFLASLIFVSVKAVSEDSVLRIVSFLLPAVTVTDFSPGDFPGAFAPASAGTGGDYTDSNKPGVVTIADSEYGLTPFML